MNVLSVPDYLRPTQQQVESACRAFYDADRRAAELRQQAEAATAQAERLRVSALELCQRA